MEELKTAIKTAEKAQTKLAQVKDPKVKAEMDLNLSDAVALIAQALQAWTVYQQSTQEDDYSYRRGRSRGRGRG